MSAWRWVPLGIMAAGWLAAAWSWHSGPDPLFWPGMALIVLPVPALLRANGFAVDGAWSRPALAAVRVGAMAEAVLAAGTLTVFGWLSVSGLDSNPPGIFCDEVEIALRARELVLDRLPGAVPPLFYEHFDYTHLGALPLYAAAPGIALLGMTDLSVRATAVVWTALAMLTLLALVRRLGWRHGWIAVALFALSPISLHMSRLGFGHAPSLLFSCVGLYAYVRAREAGSLRWAAVCGAGFGVSIYGNAAWYIAAPAMVLAVVVGELAVGCRDRRTLRVIGGAVAAFALCWVPVFVKALVDPRFMDRFRDKDDVGGPLLSLERLATMLDSYPKYYSPRYLFQVGEVGLPGGWNLRHSVPGVGLFPWLALPLVLLGIVALVRSRPGSGRVLAVTGLVMLTLYPAPDLLTTTREDPPYTFAVFPLFVCVPLLAGFGIDRSSRLVEARWRAAWPSLALAAALVAVVLTGAMRFQTGPWARYPEVAAGYYGWQYGAGEAIAAFEAHRDDYDRFWFDPDFSESRVFLDFYLADDPELRARSEVGSLERLNLREHALFAIRSERFDAYAQSDAPGRRYLRVVDMIRYPNGDIALYLVEASFANVDKSIAGW